MAASRGTGSVLVSALDDIEWQRIGMHRGPGLKMKSLTFRGDGRGNNLWLSLSEMEDGWYSPRHMHNFDQVRYVLAGETGFTKWDLHAGECAYFPAGVPYGPQEQHGSALLLTLQFPGAGPGLQVRCHRDQLPYAAADGKGLTGFHPGGRQGLVQ